MSATASPLLRLQAALAMVAAVLALPATSYATADARSEGRHSAMIIDANTGAVLHAVHADAARYPASLTKMMTLYLVFDEIERGRLSLSTRIRLSERAAAAAPSKLNLEPGEEIATADAIRALVTKSANDVAIALAEHIAGSEEAFARRMTEKARQLGMASTTFRNSSGLPDSEQVTTARDMLTLALALQDHFPQHYPFFATRTFTYKGRAYRNHNTMLDTFPGMDGLKTGYIRLSGFNLVASVRRGGRHVVAAVFGGATAGVRNAEMRSLLARTLPVAGTTRTRNSVAVAMARAPVPVRAEGKPAPPVAAPAASPARAGAPVASAAASDTPVQPIGPTFELARVRPVMLRGTREAALGETSTATTAVPARTPEAPKLLSGPVPATARGMAPSTLEQQAASLARGEPPLERAAPLPWDSLAVAPPKPPALPPPRPAAPPSPTISAATPTKPGAPGAGQFQIQVGAYASATEADKALMLALERAAGPLGNAAPLTTRIQRGGQELFRARFGGLDQQAAAKACAELRRRQIDCFVAKPE